MAMPGGTEGRLLLAKAAALHAAPDAMVMVDGEGRILFANAHAGWTFGYPCAELVGTRLDALVAPDCRSLVCEAMSRPPAGPGANQPPLRRDLFAVDRAGRSFPIELSVGRLQTDDTTLSVIVIRDVTAQKRAEAHQAAAVVEARDARERLEALLEFAPAFIIGVSGHGTIDFINRILAHYEKKDVIGSSWLQYFPPERQALMQTALETMYKTEATQIFEVTTAGPDGAPMWFDSQIAPIRAGGKVVGAVLVSQDVTERKRAQAELLAGRHMALLGTLAAGVAHEINTPIQFVADSVQFLRDAARDLVDLLDKLRDLRRAAGDGMPLDQANAAALAAEEAADVNYLHQNMPAAFDRCIDGINRVAIIVRSLKDFAHPSEKEMIPVDLNRAVQSTLTIATTEYKYVANVEMDLGELSPVTCHASEISQAVLNIVVNAAHAIADVVKDSGAKGLITVRTRREGDMAVIAISDTGNGIPEAIQARVFDPFFTTKEVGKGTGQGLAIAWATVKEHHGGELTFETKVGEGTTFYIRLPMNGAAPRVG